jgi:hypothetical protein
MPDELDDIINRMIDAGESDDDIKLVVEDYNNEQNQIKAAAAERNKFVGDVYKGPDTFWGGVWNSINPFGGGEALKASAEGAKGYAKGATVDLPSSIVGAAKSAVTGYGDLYNFANQVSPEMLSETVRGLPYGLAEGGRGIANSVLSAGSDPEGFGRATGQITGQPLVTAGIAPHVPGAIKAAGKPVAATGSFINEYAPVSRAIPRFVAPPLAKDAERFAGRLIESGGKRMQSYGASQVPPPVLNRPPTASSPILRKPGTAPPSTAAPTLEDELARALRPKPTINTASVGLPSEATTAGEGTIRQSGSFKGQKSEGQAGGYSSGRPSVSAQRYDEVVASSRNRPPNPTPNTARPPNPDRGSSNSSDRFIQQVMRDPDAPRTGDPEIDAILESFKNADQPIDVVPEGQIPNASGESAASAEAMSRNTGMRERGEKYVKYDRAGNKTDLVGPDYVDYVPGRGETYGIETPHGFILLEDNGGKVTATRTIRPKRREYPGFKGEKK